MFGVRNRVDFGRDNLSMISNCYSVLEFSVNWFLPTEFEIRKLNKLACNYWKGLRVNFNSQEFNFRGQGEFVS